MSSPTRASLPNQVASRLSALRGALVRSLLLHGFASVLGALALWLWVTFLIDWWLHVPAVIRWVHLGVLLGLFVYLSRRELWLPWQRVPNDSGLALLYERAYPNLQQSLVSAVELDPAAVTGRERQLREAIEQRAAAAASGLEPSAVLRWGGPLRRAALGAFAFVLLVGTAATDPSAFELYLRRLFGSNQAWPRQTTLAFEILGADGRPELLQSGTRELRFTKGGDLAVVVKALGKVPEEVQLFVGEERIPLAASGDSFRTFLRGLAQSVELSVEGGDDEDRDPRLRIEVLEAPDVEAVAVRIVPPAYSGLAERWTQEPQIDALAGSQLSFFVATRPASVQAEVELLPEARRIALVPREFPAALGDLAGRAGYGFDLQPERSLRYRLQLKDSNGLSNPDPGLYAITIVADRPPEAELLSPTRGDLDTVAGAWISLRARVDDDFGLSELAWTVLPQGETNLATARETALEWRELSAEEARQEASSTQQRVAVRAFARTRLSAEDLAGGTAAEGSQWQLSLVARDNAQPKRGEGRATAVRVRIVSADEFLRRVQERLNRAQGTTRTLTALAEDKQRAAEELESALSGSGVELSAAQREVGMVLTGARRVQGDSRGLTRELTALVEALLYSRVDERSQGALEAIDARLSSSTARGFDPAPWRELAAQRRRGELPAGAFAAKLVEINGVALEISEDHSAAAAQALTQATQAPSLAELREQLTSARQELSDAVRKLEQLTELLAEWDNFQTVLNLTRDILGGQKTLNERTRQYAKEN